MNPGEMVSEIKKKKELSDIPDDFIIEKLQEYLRKNKFSSEIKEKDSKIIIKELRASLRKYVGRYTNIKENFSNISDKELDGLLARHSSTKERIKENIYPWLIEKIKSCPHKKILDIACGLNPVIISKGIKTNEYYAYDLNGKFTSLVSSFFNSRGIKSKVFTEDVLKIKNFPKTDICLALKCLDIITKERRKIESLILRLNTEIIIASFSTKTLSGKSMNMSRRFWFEKILSKNNLDFEVINKSNETFYIINLS